MQDLVLQVSLNYTSPDVKEKSLYLYILLLLLLLIYVKDIHIYACIARSSAVAQHICSTGSQLDMLIRWAVNHGSHDVSAGYQHSRIVTIIITVVVHFWTHDDF